MTKPVITRFAPSPTGFLHIGGARTALFNWLYARGRGGKFLLRIEDTDRKRSTPEATQAIFDGMRWLGLDWDGDVVSQFSRVERHAEVARHMLDAGTAYKCFATKDEIDAFRARAKAEKRPPLFRSPWRDRTDHPDGEFTIRLKAPREGQIVIEDKVQGTVSWPAETMDDLILMRSDGTPTYMLAVVVDDHDMGVTHVIRGDDHLNNAFRQLPVIRAMNEIEGGWPDPVYAHVPLIHGPDGAKMSKSRGTFINARTYLDNLDPSYLRYYYAAKLGPTIEDIDLNLEDFAARVNSDLVGKVVNIASRCAGFIKKRFDGRLSDGLDQPELFDQPDPARSDRLARDRVANDLDATLFVEAGAGIDLDKVREEKIAGDEEMVRLIEAAARKSGTVSGTEDETASSCDDSKLPPADRQHYRHVVRS